MADMQNMQPAGDLPDPKPGISSPVVQAHMDELDAMTNRMPPELVERYEGLLAAGLKTMYSDGAQASMMQIIDDEEVPVANKIGEGVANLVVMMDNQTQGQVPKELLIPVACALCMEAADFLYEIGLEVTEKDLGDAMMIAVTSIFTAYGASPEQVETFVKDVADKMGFTDAEQVDEVAEVGAEAGMARGAETDPRSAAAEADINPEAAAQVPTPDQEQAEFEASFNKTRNAGV